MRVKVETLYTMKYKPNMISSDQRTTKTADEAFVKGER